MTYQTTENPMFLTDLFGIGTLELEFIKKLFKVIDNKNLGFDNSNYIIYQLLRCINKQVFSSIIHKINNEHYPFDDLNEKTRENLLKVCEDRIEDFTPEINGIASKFNNDLDYADIEGSTLDRIVEDVIKMMWEKGNDYGL